MESIAYEFKILFELGKFARQGDCVHCSLRRFYLIKFEELKKSDFRPILR